MCKSIRDIEYYDSKPLEDNWNCFKDMMNEATENHVPKIKIRQNRHNRTPISGEIFQITLKKKRKATKSFVKIEHNTPTKTTVK